MMRRTPWIFAAALAFAGAVLGSCGSTPDTGIRLEVDAALAPGHELTRVRVRTFDVTDPMHTIDEHDFTIAINATTVPFSMSIVPRDAAHRDMDVGIEVRGTIGPGPDAVARVHTAFVPGRILVVPVVLHDDCDPPCMAPSTCGAGRMCVGDMRIDPSVFAVYGVDAGPDVTDIGFDDASDSHADVVDAAPIDAADAVDAVDVADTADTVMPDAIDATDAVDVVDVPADNGLGDACGMGYCPNGGMGPWICGPPELPPDMQNTCCQPNGMLSSCAGVVCTNGYTCMIDPRGHAACCGPPLHP
jgi:hypothetical protein